MLLAASIVLGLLIAAGISLNRLFRRTPAQRRAACQARLLRRLSLALLRQRHPGLARNDRLPQEEWEAVWRDARARLGQDDSVRVPMEDYPNKRPNSTDASG